MTEPMTEAPEIMVATVEYGIDDAIHLRLETEERTKAEFVLHPIAAALLSLTLNPALKLALDAEKRKHPEAERGGFPDTPEGL